VKTINASASKDLVENSATRSSAQISVQTVVNVRPRWVHASVMTHISVKTVVSSSVQQIVLAMVSVTKRLVSVSVMLVTMALTVLQAIALWIARLMVLVSIPMAQSMLTVNVNKAGWEVAVKLKSVQTNVTVVVVKVTVLILVVCVILNGADQTVVSNSVQMIVLARTASVIQAHGNANAKLVSPISTVLGKHVTKTATTMVSVTMVHANVILGGLVSCVMNQLVPTTARIVATVFFQRKTSLKAISSVVLYRNFLALHHRELNVVAVLVSVVATVRLLNVQMTVLVMVCARMVLASVMLNSMASTVVSNKLSMVPTHHRLTLMPMLNVPNLVNTESVCFQLSTLSTMM
jgi:hypothetical protein